MVLVCPGSLGHLSIDQCDPRQRPEHVRIRIRVSGWEPDEKVDTPRRIGVRQWILMDDDMSLGRLINGIELVFLGD